MQFVSGTGMARQDTATFANEKSQQLNTLIDFNEKRLLDYSSFIEGHFIMVCTGMPKIMEDLDPVRTNNIKNLLNTHITGVSGIQDLTMEFAEVNNGNDGNSFETSIKSTGVTKEFTATMPSDVAGATMINFSEELIRIISDPDSGQSYPSNPNLRIFSPANHSFTFQYMNVTPDYRYINKAFLFQKCELVSANLEKFNAKKGEVSINELELNFKCNARSNRNPILKAANDYLVECASNWDSILSAQNASFG